LHGTTDLVVLPETFTSGFSNEAIGNAETMDGPTVAWMREQASRLDAAVTGSVQLRTEAGVFNRMLFATPDGNLAHYDKRHLFSFAKENERYAAGHDRVGVEWRGWRILLQVCYDLRFPVFSRNRFDLERPGLPDYDLALYVANWPSARSYPWKALLRARAIENLCYVVGVNRVGTDGNGLHYSGDSAAIDFLGHPLSEAADEEVVSTMLFTSPFAGGPGPNRCRRARRLLRVSSSSRAGRAHCKQPILPPTAADASDYPRACTRAPGPTGKFSQVPCSSTAFHRSGISWCSNSQRTRLASGSGTTRPIVPSRCRLTSFCSTARTRCRASPSISPSGGQTLSGSS